MDILPPFQDTKLLEQSNTMDWINSWELLCCLSVLPCIPVLSKPNTPSWHSRVYVMNTIYSCSYIQINVHVNRGNSIYTGDITYKIHRFLEQYVHIIGHLPGKIRLHFVTNDTHGPEIVPRQSADSHAMRSNMDVNQTNGSWLLLLPLFDPLRVDPRVGILDTFEMGWRLPRYPCPYSCY